MSSLNETRRALRELQKTVVQLVPKERTFVLFQDADGNDENELPKEYRPGVDKLRIARTLPEFNASKGGYYTMPPGWEPDW